MILLKLAVFVPIAAALALFVYLTMGWFGLCIAVAGAAFSLAAARDRSPKS